MGDLSGVSPPKMDWDSADLPTAFRAFKQFCTLIFAGPFGEKTDEEKATYILIWVGQEGLKMFNSWNLSIADSKSLNAYGNILKGTFGRRQTLDSIDFIFKNSDSHQMKPYMSSRRNAN